ncbi:MAG: hypothetical protein E6G28_09855 [Actinobacteria bacterium]|nr:MAG: hypothetical protein E6G28_09855 [Actinomycetota bacterium]
MSGVLLLAAAFVLGWLLERRRLAPDRPVTVEERLGGYAVALTWLCVVAVVVALTTPYALIFVLPSLYAWLWLPVRHALWARTTLFAVGLLGPLAALLVLSNQLGLSLPRGAFYVTGLATVGYIPARSVILALAWVAGAAQIAALACGRYAPYRNRSGRV